MGKRMRLKAMILVLGTIYITVTIVLLALVPIEEMLGEARWKWVGLYFLVMLFFSGIGGAILYFRLTTAVKLLEAHEKKEKPSPELIESTRKLVLTYPAIGTLRVGLFIVVGITVLGMFSLWLMDLDWAAFRFYLAVASTSIIFTVTFVFFILKRTFRPVVKILFQEDPDIWEGKVSLRISIRTKLIVGFLCMVAVMGLLILVTNSYFIGLFQKHISDLLVLEELQMSVWKNTLIALFVATLMGAVIAWLISGDIAWPLKLISDAAESISRGKRREGVPWISEDETGALATAINRMTTGLLVTLQGEVTRAENLLKSLGETVKTLAKSADSIAEISSRQAESASEQTNNAQQAGAASVEISAVARRIADHAKDVEEMSARARESGEAGGQDLNDAIRGINSAANRFKKVSEAVRNLGERSREIRYVLELIEEISTQINLLAINASLEAVGAGDAGRRFGVVAVEVGRLAEKTTEAIGRIDIIIKEVSSAVNDTLVMAEETGEAIFASADVAQGLEESFQHILELVNSTNRLALEIEKSTLEQNTACDQMVETIQGFAELADEIEADTRDLAGSVQSLADHAERLKNSTQN